MVSESSGVGPDIDAIRRDVNALKRDVTSLLSDVRSATAERAGQLYGNIRDNGPDAVRERVRDRPLAALALAFLAGVVVAGVMRR